MSAQQNAAAVIDRRRKVAEMYLRGTIQADIARQLGVVQGTVSRDLAAIRADWRQSAVMDFDARKDQELAKIDEVERAAWDGWRRSQEPAETTRAEISGDVQKAVKTTEGQAGDPRFLQTVLNCVERRCRILGIDAPDKVSVSGPSYKVYVGFDPEVAIAAVAREHRQLEATDGDQAGDGNGG